MRADGATWRCTMKLPRFPLRSGPSPRRAVCMIYCTSLDTTPGLCSLARYRLPAPRPAPLGQPWACRGSVRRERDPDGPGEGWNVGGGGARPAGIRGPIYRHRGASGVCGCGGLSRLHCGPGALGRQACQVRQACQPAHVLCGSRLHCRPGALGGPGRRAARPGRASQRCSSTRGLALKGRAE